jgi:hypothetical protein
MGHCAAGMQPCCLCFVIVQSHVRCQLDASPSLCILGTRHVYTRRPSALSLLCASPELAGAETSPCELVTVLFRPVNLRQCQAAAVGMQTLTTAAFYCILCAWWLRSPTTQQVRVHGRRARGARALHVLRRVFRDLEVCSASGRRRSMRMDDIYSKRAYLTSQPLRSVSHTTAYRRRSQFRTCGTGTRFTCIPLRIVAWPGSYVCIVQNACLQKHLRRCRSSRQICC